MSALSPKSRIESFSHACDGLAALVRTQANARIHLAATIAVTAAGFLCHLQPWEWVSIIFAITIVWTAEALNTGLECLSAVVTLERTPAIKAAKDIAAGGVLVAAIGAALVGAIVFLPHVVSAVAS